MYRSSLSHFILAGTQVGYQLPHDQHAKTKIPSHRINR